MAPSLPSAWPFQARDASVSATTWEQDGWTWEGIGRLDLVGEGGEPLERAFGRGGVFRSGSSVVRPYRRGGLFGKVVRRWYPSPSRFRDEFGVHLAIWQSGFPTVRPVACAWRPFGGFGVEGRFVTEFSEGEPWPRTWAGGEATLKRVWQAIEALCQWGLWAPDLNATNVLVQVDGTPLLLDWDRACWFSSSTLLDRYKSRLRRSLVKLQAPQNLIDCLEVLCFQSHSPMGSR